MPYSYYPADVLPDEFCVVGADNDLLFSDDGTAYIDLLCGCGAVLLGHGNPAIVAKLRAQLESLWITGAVPTRIGNQLGRGVKPHRQTIQNRSRKGGGIVIL